MRSFFEALLAIKWSYDPYAWLVYNPISGIISVLLTGSEFSIKL